MRNSLAFTLILLLCFVSLSAPASAQDSSIYTEDELNHYLADYLNTIEFKGSFQLTRDAQAIGIVKQALHGGAYYISVNTNSFKLVVIPQKGAKLTHIDGSSVENIEAAIFHTPKNLEFSFSLSESGYLLIIVQKNSVLPGNKDSFHYSHFVSNINPYSNILVYITTKETIK